MSDDKQPPIEDESFLGMYNSIFLKNLERWIDEIVTRDGLTDRELIRTIKGKFELAIQSNIEHHRFMAKNAGAEYAERHQLMADIYESLLTGKSVR